jgi:hypothetical protein
MKGKMMKAKGKAMGGKMKSKGMAMGGKMKSKGYRMGGKAMDPKKMAKGGKSGGMTLASIRKAAKAKGYKVVKA